MKHGAFVFRNEGDGCLTSKYMHDDGGPFTESCVRRGDERTKGPTASITVRPVPNDEFIGEYLTTYLDGHDNHWKNGFLTIERHDTINRLFKLVWFDESKTRHMFEGQGMLHGLLLVGAYWNG